MAHLKAGMTPAQIDELAAKCVGIFAYNEYINKPVNRETEVERFLELPEEERTRWYNVEIGMNRMVLSGTPKSIIEAFCKQLSASDNKNCNCETCNFMQMTIQCYLVEHAKSEHAIRATNKETHSGQ